MIDASHVISQSDRRWGQAILGSGKRTIASSGCLLCCLVMASNAMRGTNVGVIQANEMILGAGGFAGSGLNFRKAAKVLGLDQVYVGQYYVKEAAAAIANGDLAVFGIDYKEGSSSGLSDADHFVLGVGVDGSGSWRIADPATGLLGLLPQTEKTIYRGPHAVICEMRILTPLGVVVANA